MKHMEIPYNAFRRFIRGMDRFDALHTLWVYHRHIVDGQPLLAGYASGRPPQLDLGNHLWPWMLDTLSREVILHAGRDPRPRHRLVRFDHLATALNAINKLGDLDEDSDTDVLLHMHRLAHQQFPWQSGGWDRASVIRAWKVFGTEALDGLVQSAFGMTMQQLVWLGFAVGGNFISKWGMTTLTDYQNPLGISPEATRTFFDTLARTPRELRALAIPLQVFDDGWEYTWNPLRAHPLVRYDPQRPDYVLCPIPRFAQERITSGVFYDLVRRSGFAGAFGPAFETYIGQVLGAACSDARFTLTPESPYHVGRQLKHGVDWSLDDGQSTLFIECKTKRMSIGAKGLTDPAGLSNDLAILAEAIVQHYQNIDDILQGRAQRPVPTGTAFMMVVTLESWHLMSKTVRDELNDLVVHGLAASNLALTLPETMPWQVIAAHELEKLLQIINAEGISPVMAAKTGARHRDWDVTGFVFDARPAWNARFVPLFPEDEARLFPSWMTRERARRHASDAFGTATSPTEGGNG